MGQLQSERDALLGTMQPTGPAQVASSTVASMEQRLRLYEQFTALSMTVAEDSQGTTGDSDEDDRAEGLIRCEARNKVTGSAVSFELEYDDEDGEWSYTPGQNAHILPSHLRDEICFPESSAPMFVTQLVSALYAVGGDASADEENENENEPADE